MPQMSPMNWTSLYIYFLILLLILMIKSFFFYTPKINSYKISKNKNKMFNWKW